MFDRTGQRKYLNESERTAYLKASRSETDPSRRAFLLTLYYTGCRISEALNLQAGRVDFAAKAVVFETLKRRKRGCFRSVSVPDELVDLLRELLAEKGPAAKIWGFSRSTGYRMIKSKMDAAHVIGGMAMPKGLRHGHAIACVAVKVPLPTLQTWLGHARIETTAIYLEVQGQEERSLAERLWRTPENRIVSGIEASMNFTVALPDAFARCLGLDGPDAETRVREVFAVHGYRNGQLSRRQVGEFLDLSSHDTEDFLKANRSEIPLGGTGLPQ